ncbi:MAG: hypothetical protein IPO92_14715 [Saprospiraceae bacterium]|nr:hypothetical protein [Saprospiraceae bacterium]
MEGYYVYLPSVFIYDGFVKGAVRDTAYLKNHIAILAGFIPNILVGWH